METIRRTYLCGTMDIVTPRRAVRAYESACKTLKQSLHAIPVLPGKYEDVAAAFYNASNDRTPIRRSNRELLSDLERMKWCDSVYMIQGWEDSTLAQIEHMLANALNKNILYQRK